MKNKSFHFIPLNNKNHISKIKNLRADFFILDLEDSVSKEEKEIARNNLRTCFGNLNLSQCFLRINTESEEDMDKDVRLINELQFKNVVVPKISIDLAKKANISFSFEPNFFLFFETMNSIYDFDKIIKTIDNISYVGIGFEDLLADNPYDKNELTSFIKNISSQFVFKSKVFSLKCIDGISVSKESDTFNRECLYSKSQGFDGKMAIYPYQIDIINEVWSISKKDYLFAKSIIQKYGDVSSLVGYRMVDDILLSPIKIKKLKTIIKCYES